MLKLMEMEIFSLFYVIFFFVYLGLSTIMNLFISVRLKNNHQIHRLGYWALSLHHRCRDSVLCRPSDIVRK